MQAEHICTCRYMDDKATLIIYRSEALLQMKKNLFKD
jgi:hypothetical protein